MKKIIYMLVSLMLVLSLSACSGKAATEKDDSVPEKKAAETDKVFMTFGGPTASGSNFSYWVAIGKAIQQQYPQYQITVSETQGGFDIAKRMRGGQITAGNSLSNTDYDNYLGVGSFEGQGGFEDLRILWYYEKRPMCFTALQSENINSISDISGKKYSGGGAGTAGQMLSEAVASSLGVTPNWFDAGQQGALDAMSNKQISGMGKICGIPDSTLTQLFLSVDSKIIPFSDEEISKIKEKLPYIMPYTVPANTYKGQTEDINTFAIGQGAQASTALSQEAGYHFIKAVMSEEGQELWRSAYPPAGEFDIVETTLELSTVPLHAGTVQYFEELGYTVPEHLIPEEYVPVSK